MRMKPARNMASGDNGNKNQFTQNFFYNFMRSNGGYQSDPYTALKRKL